MTGKSAGFSAWRKMTRRMGSPLANAVRMKLEFITSSMEDRVIRAIDAM